MGLFNSKTTQAEDYEYEDFTYKQLPPFPSDQRVERQDTSISDALSSVTTLITVGVAFVAANLFLAVALKPERQKLENDAMCGVTTGGEVGKNNIGHFKAVQPFLSFSPNATLTVLAHLT